MRWDDIVSRVFGRIDPIALSGEDYRRSAPNIDVYGQHTRFGPVQADGRYLLRTDDGEEFTADQVVIAAGARPMVPPAILASGVDYHTSDTVMRIAELPEHLVIIGSGFVAAEFAHIFSALGVRVTMVIRGGTLLRHYDDTICERFTRIASSKWELHTHRNVVGAHQPRIGRGAGTRRRFAHSTPTCCWWRPAGCPTAIYWTPSRPESTSRTAGWWSTNTNGPPRVGFSRSATSRRRISSSTSPTTRRASCSTICSATGTTPTSMAVTDHRYRTLGGVHRSSAGQPSG